MTFLNLFQLMLLVLVSGYVFGGTNFTGFFEDDVGNKTYGNGTIGKMCHKTLMEMVKSKLKKLNVVLAQDAGNSSKNGTSLSSSTKPSTSLNSATKTSPKPTNSSTLSSNSTSKSLSSTKPSSTMKPIKPKNSTLSFEPIHRFCCNCFDTRINHVYTMSLEHYSSCLPEGSPGYLAKIDEKELGDTKCGNLTKLYGFNDVKMHDLNLVTSSQRNKFKNNTNYEEMEFLGYCAPSKGYCQADIPLYEVDSTGIPGGRIDHFYTSNFQEQQAAIWTNPWYQGGGKGVLCWIWNRSEKMILN